MTVDEQRFREAERDFWASRDAAVTERWCELPRLGATVRLQELGEGPAVVFIHGASNGGTSWAHLATPLSSNFRCILVDRPGCGLSPPLREGLADISRLDAFADTLVADLLDACDIETAHVVATSFGGYFGLRSAAAHPDRITRLVVLGWTFGAPTTSAPMAIRVASLPFLGRLMTRIPPNERMVRALLQQIGLRGAVETGQFGPVEVAWFLSLLRDTNTMRNEIDGNPRVLTMRGFNRATLLPDELLAAIEVPTLFLWGTDDPLGDAELARTFTSRIPVAELEMLSGAGHAPWIDDPDGVSERVRDFLSAHSDDPRPDPS